MNIDAMALLFAVIAIRSDASELRIAGNDQVSSARIATNRDLVYLTLVADFIPAIQGSIDIVRAFYHPSSNSSDGVRAQY